MKYNNIKYGVYFKNSDSSKIFKTYLGAFRYCKRNSLSFNVYKVIYKRNIPVKVYLGEFND